MLSILFLNRNNKDAFGELFTQYEFEQAVGKLADCKYAGEGFPDYIAGESVDKTVKRVMPEADWVIGDPKSCRVKKSMKRKYKIGAFINDLHGENIYGAKSPVEWGKMIVKANYDGIFIRTSLVYGTGYNPKILYNMLGDKAHWFPWSVNTDRYHPRDKKKYDVAFLGDVTDNYPLHKMLCDGIYHVARGFKVLCNGPTYCNSKPEHDYIKGDEYSEALGSTRILIFGCSKYHYPPLKLFEGGASGCLLMCDSPSMIEELGFMSRVTYTEIAAYNWEDGLRFFLEHPKEARKISEPCMGMVRKYHSHDVRAKQFLQILKE